MSSWEESLIRELNAAYAEQRRLRAELEATLGRAKSAESIMYALSDALRDQLRASAKKTRVVNEAPQGCDGA